MMNRLHHIMFCLRHILTLRLTTTAAATTAAAAAAATTTTTTTTTALLRPFFRDYPGEPVPEETFIQSHLS